MTVVLDDHLLRDWLTGPDRALWAAVGNEPIITTNLWYARLCKSAAASTGGALLGRWSPERRQSVVAALVALPEDIGIVPMQALAWRMGVLVAEHSGLSTLGAEAVAAAEALSARILVSARDDGPGLRRCCRSVGVPYRALPRPPSSLGQ